MKSIDTYCEIIKSIKGSSFYDKGVMRIALNNMGKVFYPDPSIFSKEEFNDFAEIAKEFGVFIARYKDSVLICDIERVMHFFNLFETDSELVDLIYYRTEDVRFKEGYCTYKYDDIEEEDEDLDDDEEYYYFVDEQLVNDCLNELAIYGEVETINETKCISNVSLSPEDFERTVEEFGGHRKAHTEWGFDNNDIKEYTMTLNDYDINLNSNNEIYWCN